MAVARLSLQSVLLVTLPAIGVQELCAAASEAPKPSASESV